MIARVTQATSLVGLVIVVFTQVSSMKTTSFFNTTHFVAALTIVVASGCSPSPPSVLTLQSAPNVIVYEGLPHQLREPELLEREEQRPDITTIGGFSFYTPGVAAIEKQARELKEILGDKNNYYTYTGEPKDCGPFHPDFAVEWTDGKTKRQILICFTCAEARILSENTEENYDLNNVDKLKSRLKEFSSKRPKQ